MRSDLVLAHQFPEGAAVLFRCFGGVGDIASAIPDLGTLNSTVSVAGLITPIKRVSVSMHITHTADNDLDISLIGPDGTIIDLSSDNGGTASDYGTDCTDAARTLFIDSAATSIISGAAPFVGSFRP